MPKKSAEEKRGVKVVVRLRPLSEKELLADSKDITFVSENSIILEDPNPQLQKKKQKRYEYDEVFDMYFRNSDIFNESVKDMIEKVLQGYSSLIFLYGPTGSGKTHTCMGTDLDPGLNFLALEAICDSASQYPNLDLCFKFSFIEVFNELIFDLVGESGTQRVPLALREDSNSLGVNIVGLSEHTITSSEEAIKLLCLGNERRAVESTHNNQFSSRSHAITMLTVEIREKSSNGVETGFSAECLPFLGELGANVTVGRLMIVDLAGSERASPKGALESGDHDRVIEGGRINQSLLALSKCLVILAERKGRFVPYRDSKLTRILKNSLQGDSINLMISCISPSNKQFEETLNTLKYSEGAMKIQGAKAEIHCHTAAMTDTEYRHIITDLRSELRRLNEVVDSHKDDIVPQRPHRDSVDSCTQSSLPTISLVVDSPEDPSTVQNPNTNTDSVAPMRIDSERGKAEKLSEVTSELDSLKVEAQTRSMELTTNPGDDFTRRASDEAMDTFLNTFITELRNELEKARDARRELMDLETQNMRNVEAIALKEKELRPAPYRHKRSTSSSSATSDLSGDLVSEIAGYRESIVKNTTLADVFRENAKRSEIQSRKLCEDASKQMVGDGMYMMLKMVLDAHATEVENMEYEINLKRKNQVIEEQRRVLMQHGLGHIAHEMQSVNQAMGATINNSDAEKSTPRSWNVPLATPRVLSFKKQQASDTNIETPREFDDEMNLVKSRLNELMDEKFSRLQERHKLMQKGEYKPSPVSNREFKPLPNFLQKSKLLRNQAHGRRSLSDSGGDFQKAARQAVAESSQKGKQNDPSDPKNLLHPHAPNSKFPKVLMNRREDFSSSALRKRSLSDSGGDYKKAAREAIKQLKKNESLEKPRPKLRQSRTTEMLNKQKMNAEKRKENAVKKLGTMFPLPKTKGFTSAIRGAKKHIAKISSKVSSPFKERPLNALKNEESFDDAPHVALSAPYLKGSYHLNPGMVRKNVTPVKDRPSSGKKGQVPSRYVSPAKLQSENKSRMYDEVREQTQDLRLKMHKLPDSKGTKLPEMPHTISSRSSQSSIGSDSDRSFNLDIKITSNDMPPLPPVIHKRSRSADKKIPPIDMTGESSGRTRDQSPVPKLNFKNLKGKG